MLPIIMASRKASEQSFKQQKQMQAGPRLMQLPHLFQVIQSKCEFFLLHQAWPCLPP